MYTLYWLLLMGWGGLAPLQLPADPAKNDTLAQTPALPVPAPATTDDPAKSLTLRHTITGNIEPKSIAHSGTGRFFAQSMMYKHHITVYDRNYNIVSVIDDKVRLSDYGITGYTGWHQGAPVEAAFSPDGAYAWVSNYRMYGQGFDKPGSDACAPSDDYDHAYVYKINTRTLKIEQVIAVGAVPKYLAVTPDGEKLLVANWCSGDLSVVDIELGVQVQRVFLGSNPRGIAIDSKSRFAYVALMGDDRIARIKLSDYSLEWIEGVGRGPRHLCLEPADRFLYVSVNRSGQIAKIDLVSRKVIKYTDVGREPRSMVLSPGGAFLYVVNYKDNTLAKIDAASMELLETVDTQERPVGVTLDTETRTVWVACYAGAIQIFEDAQFPVSAPTPEFAQNNLLPVRSQSTYNSNTYVPRSGTQPEAQDPSYYVTPNDGQCTRELPQTTDPRPKPTVQVPEPAPRYYLIVGNYSDRANAMTRVRELERLGYHPTILDHDNGSVRVSLQTFDSREAANQAAQLYKTRYQIEGWILQQ
ncbi:MAG: hypothetical protein OHK0039_27090 [Bacteroidia bacterium]